MKIIRNSDQSIVTRSTDNRQVQVIFNQAIQNCDWLMITHSREIEEHEGNISISFHRHPNALELIVFQKPSVLDIDGVRHDFDSGDLVIIEPHNTHGSTDLSEHDCICLLLGKGEPIKQSYNSI